MGNLQETNRQGSPGLGEGLDARFGAGEGSEAVWLWMSHGYPSPQG